MTLTHAEDRSDYDELAEYLRNLLVTTRRQPRITAKFTTDQPTNWDRMHAKLDSALDDILLVDKPCA